MITIVMADAHPAAGPIMACIRRLGIEVDLETQSLDDGRTTVLVQLAAAVDSDETERVANSLRSLPGVQLVEVSFLDHAEDTERHE